jgi:hypothetical protein
LRHFKFAAKKPTELSRAREIYEESLRLIAKHVELGKVICYLLCFKFDPGQDVHVIHVFVHVQFSPNTNMYFTDWTGPL